MRRPATALAISVLLATGVAACGGDPSESSDVVPRSTPELVAPEDTGLPPATGSSDESTRTSTSTTSTTETTPEDGTAAEPAAPVTPAPTPAQPTPAAPEAGGQQAPPAQTQEQQGEGGGNSGGFSDFCAENPGACPEE